MKLRKWATRGVPALIVPLIAMADPAAALVINRTATVDLAAYGLPSSTMATAVTSPLNAAATLNQDDTLIVTATFANGEALKWTDIAGDSDEFIHLLLRDGPDFVGALGYAATLTFNGVSGDLLENGLSSTFSGALSGFFIRNLTDSMFSFTGFTIETTITNNADPIMVDGLSINARLNGGTQTGDVFTRVPAGMPEPGTLALFGLGLTGLATVRRRRAR